MSEPPLSSDSAIIEKRLDRLKQERHVERPEDSLFSEPIPSEPIQESPADVGGVEITFGTITDEMIDPAGRGSPFPPSNWEATREMVLGPESKDFGAKIRAIGNTAHRSDTRDLPPWAVLELINLFGGFAVKRFRDRLMQESGAPNWQNLPSEVILQKQLNFKSEIRGECLTLYDDALAGIATPPFAVRDQSLRKAVENRASESIDALIRVLEPKSTLAVSETDTKPAAKNTDPPTESEVAAVIAQNNAGDGEAPRGSKATDLFPNHVVASGSIPSPQRMGTPGLDVQRSFPPIRYCFTGGPHDPSQRADLCDEIGWLARDIQVLEGPSGFPPGEALDRLLDRLTARKGGEVDMEYTLNELKKHCRASGVHGRETGESAKGGAFEGFAVRVEGLQSRFFGKVPPRRSDESRFSGQHKVEFRELLALGVELRAINSHPSSLDFGPWQVGYLNGDSADPQHRIKKRFRAAVRKAAIAAGAPSRVNLLDWWISRLARGKKLHYIQGVIQHSADYCEELESNALELKPLIDESNAAPGLRRDRYPCDHPVPYWLYAEPHRALPDPKEEFAFWDERVWGNFSRSIEEVAGWRRERRRWVDKDGVMHVEPSDEARRQLSKRVARRTELLAAWTLGLSYDVAVHQANYIIDRGLRGEDAMRMFEHETEQLVEKVRQLWRTTAKRWGLSWRKLETQDTDFGKPFRQVGADLRELIFSAFMVGAHPTQLTSTSPTNSELDSGPAATEWALAPTDEAQAAKSERREGVDSGPLSGSTPPNHALEHQDPPGETGEPARKTRGRRRKFSAQQLETARQMKGARKTNNEIAKVLYGSNPTEAQRRSVPTTLKYHFGRKTASKSGVEN